MLVLFVRRTKAKSQSLSETQQQNDYNRSNSTSGQGYNQPDAIVDPEAEIPPYVNVALQQPSRDRDSDANQNPSHVRQNNNSGYDINDNCDNIYDDIIVNSDTIYEFNTLNIESA